MNERNKIYDYIEGNLNESEKSELFKELSVNKDMREEFEYANSMSKTLSESKDLFILPSGSKGILFSELGLSFTGAAASSSFLASKTFIGAVSSIVTFALLSTFYFVALNEDVISNTNQYDHTFFKINKEVDLPVIDNNYNNLKIGDESIDIRDIANNENRRFDKINSQSAQNDLVINDELIEKLANSEIILINKSNLSQVNVSDFNFTTNNSKIDNLNEIQSENSSKSSKIYLEWNNTINQNLPEESISPSTLQNFNNNNLGIYYILSESIDLGFEVRQENFFQIYEDRLKLYEQTPNFTTYSIAMKYNFWNEKFINNLSNYAKAQFGGNNGGFVSRFALGLNYELYDGFYLNSNLEYSNLLFKNNYNQFNSNKISINYGIKYNF